MQLQKAIIDTLFLFNQSPDHRIYTLVEFNQYALLPILHKKARLFYSEDKPVGFVSWAWLTKEEGEAFLSEKWGPNEDVYKRKDEVTSDLNLWCIEYIAPYGQVRPIMKAMRQHSLQQLGQSVPAHWRRLKHPDKLHKRRL